MSEKPGHLRPGGRFDTTRWSLVLAAGDSKSPKWREALETLCQAYWPAVYAYVRRRGHDAVEAQDLTQGFFAHLLEGQRLKAARKDRGRHVVGLSNVGV